MEDTAGRPVTATPINLLHPEILVKIFALLVHAQDVFSQLKSCPKSSDKPFSWIPYPLPLSCVCRRWRDIIISNPLLWTELHLFPPWKITLPSIFLERSAACPVDFYLWAMIESYPRHVKAISRRGTVSHWTRYDGEAANARTLFELIQKNARRCGKISVQTDHRFRSFLEAFKDYFRKSPTAVPSLQALYLQDSLMPLGVDPDGKKRFTFLESLPALTDLRIATSIDVLPVLYSQLVVLHISMVYFSWPQFYDLVSRCNVLQTLAVYGKSRESGPPQTDQGGTVTLPSLSSLLLYDVHFLRVFQILSLFSAPLLRHLVIAPFVLGHRRNNLRWVDHDLDDPGRSIVLQSIKEFPAIKVLAIALPDYHLGYINDAIRCASGWFPCLEEAVLVGRGASFVIERALNVEPADTHGETVWPRLHTLAIRSPVGEPHDLFASREAIGHPIRRLYVDRKTLRDQPELLDVKGLQVIERDVWDELRRDGLYPGESYRGD